LSGEAATTTRELLFVRCIIVLPLFGGGDIFSTRRRERLESRQSGRERRRGSTRLELAGREAVRRRRRLSDAADGARQIAGGGRAAAAAQNRREL